MLYDSLKWNNFRRFAKSCGIKGIKTRKDIAWWLRYQFIYNASPKSWHFPNGKYNTFSEKDFITAESAGVVPNAHRTLTTIKTGLRNLNKATELWFGGLE